MSDNQTWRDVNRIELRGRLGRDPEIRSMASGSQVASVSVATSEHWTDKRSGEKKQLTQWHNVSTFDPEHITTLANLHKGQRVHLTGMMTYREWTDNTGSKRIAAEVKVGKFDTLALVPDDRQPAREQSHAAMERSVSTAPRSAVEDDEVPF